MKQYKEELYSLRFTQEQKKAMVEHLLDAEKERKTVKMIKWKRTVGIGLAAALCLTVTGFALPNSPIRRLASEVFAGILGGDPELADALGAPVGISASNNGITVTADAVIGDENNVCIVYSVARDDGQPLDTAENITSLNFDPTSEGLMEGVSWSGHGSSYFTDSDPSDNAVQYVETVSVDGASPHGKTISIKLKNLMRYEETGESTMVAEGVWKLKVPLNYTDTTRHLEYGKTLEIEGQQFTVAEIALSPIGYYIAVESSEAIPYKYDEKAPDSSTASTGGGVAINADGTQRAIAPDGDSREKYYHNLQITLRLKDGSVLNLSDGGGGMSNTDGDRLCIFRSGTFESILPLEDMDTLTLGNTVISIRP